jgi:fructokinase
MKKITSIGEILFDVYEESITLGGAPFNFIYHILKLTGQGNFISRIGNDELGGEIKQFFRNNNVSDKYLQIDETHKTGVAKAELDERKVPTFTIETERAYDFIETTDTLIGLVKNDTDCLYFGSLAQRNEVSKGTIRKLFNLASVKFCDLNLRQNFYSKDVIEQSLYAANIVKLNSDELQIVNKFFNNNNFSQIDSIESLINKFSIDLVCVTDGENGATIVNKNYESDTRNIKNENVVDTVGAGDAYAAILCIGYLNNLNFRKINKLANEFAGEIVKVKGALPENDLVYNKFKEYLKNE